MFDNQIDKFSTSMNTMSMDELKTSILVLETLVAECKYNVDVEYKNRKAAEKALEDYTASSKLKEQEQEKNFHSRMNELVSENSELIEKLKKIQATQFSFGLACNGNSPGGRWTSHTLKELIHERDRLLTVLQNPKTEGDQKILWDYQLDSQKNELNRRFNNFNEKQKNSVLCVLEEFTKRN
jgi:hypothetical protein